MKILVFNWQDIRNPDAGGAEVHFHEIYSRVAALGHTVTLFCSSFEGAAPEEIIDGIRVIRKGGRYLFNIQVAIAYLTRFRFEGYDVVIDDMNKIPFFTMLYVRKPLYVIIHHLFGKSIFVEATLPVASYVYLLEKLAVKLLHARRVRVMVVSPSTEKEMLDEGLRKDQIEIVYNCVDHSRFLPNPSERSTSPVVAYVGRLKRYKSVEHLLQAFAILRRDYVDLKLLVVGEGDYRRTLEQYAEGLGLREHVCFTGFVSEADKVILLQRAWFVVNTSSKEGWGLTVIEANACRTAVIGSNVPGLRDAIQDGVTGLLYEYGNIEQLADRMDLLLRDQEFRNRLAENAYQWSLSFDWGKMAEHSIQLLQREIDKHSTHPS